MDCLNSKIGNSIDCLGILLEKSNTETGIPIKILWILIDHQYDLLRESFGAIRVIMQIDQGHSNSIGDW